MTTTADVVVAGGGHNSLITAAYLAKAGLECVVLDAGPVLGGGAVTEELLLPGHKIDTCSTGHTLIRVTRSSGTMSWASSENTVSHMSSPIRSHMWRFPTGSTSQCGSTWTGPVVRWLGSLGAMLRPIAA